MNARFAHVNLIARNWQRLARFYTTVFGCVLVPPERDFQGKELDAGTGLKGARLRGAHLRLPGAGDQGPTLEIFTHDRLQESLLTAANRPGFGHIASSCRKRVSQRSSRESCHSGRLPGSDGR
jgi:catechol 2,3-dioxygenase-like lactoylglutathione lyase family enzyme